MPKASAVPIDFYQNTDGMMPIYAGPHIPPTGARQIKNCNLTPIGGFSRRSGYARDNATAQVVSGVQSGLYEIVLSNGTHKFLGTCDTKIGVRSAGVSAWTDKTGVLTITAGLANLFSFDILNDITVACNDVDTVIQVDSSFTAAVLAGSPAFTSALFPVSYRGYMFYGNVVEGGTRLSDRLRFSANNAPNSFTSTDFIDLAKKQGGQLRGAIVYKDRLICFKENNTYEILFQPTRVASDGTTFPFLQNANPILPGVGIQSHRTLVRFTTPDTHQTPGDFLFFVDQYGMPRVMDFYHQTRRIGYPISQSRDTTLVTLSKMDRSVAGLRAQFAVNYPERNQIWVFMSQSTQTDTVWILDYTFKWAWSYHKFDVPFTCAMLAQHTDGTYRVFTGDKNGFTCRQDTTDLDNATTIPWFYEAGDIYKINSTLRCNWPFFEMRGLTPDSTQLINVSFIPDGNDIATASKSVDLSSSQPKWGAVVWGQFNWSKTGTIAKTLNPSVDAKMMRVQFSSLTGSNGMVEGWTFAPRIEGTFYE